MVRAALLAAALALPGQAPAQERLSLAPGHSLRLHPATPEQPASLRYSLDLAEGDWLAVTAPAAIVNGAGTEPPIRLLGPAGQETRDFGRLVQRIAAAGTWTLELRDAHAVAISRYPAGHPVVEPGLDPAAVRLAPGGLGAVAMATEPMEPRYDDVPPPSGWPARLAIQVGRAMAIHLYRRAGLRQIELWPHDPSRNLVALLEGEATIEPSLALPMFPLGNHYVAFVAQSERVRGACFTYLRYIARWAQEDAWPFDILAYVALGVSRDGEWLAVATADVAPLRMPDQPAQVQEGRSADYEAALRRAIAADPAALTPGLATLDSVIASLTLPCQSR